MTKTFTQYDLIRYVFNETSNEENIAIEALLTMNPEWREFVEANRAIMYQMDSVLMEPSETSVNNIMAYVKSVSLQPVKA